MSIIRNLMIRMGLADLSVQRDPIAVFVLDDDARRHRFFKRRFKGDHIEIAEDVEEAKTVLSSGAFDAIFLDHDLLPHHYESNDHDDFDSTGFAIATWLAENEMFHRSSTIIVHTRNADGGLKMVEKLRKVGRRVEYVPFPLLEAKIKHYWGK